MCWTPMFLIQTWRKSAGIGNTPNSHIAIPRLQQRPAWYGKRTALFFLLGGQMSLYACAGASVLWESCPVTRSPSCGRLHRQTVKPLPPPTCVVSSSTHVFGWTDHGASTASSGANITRMRPQQGQEDQTNERSGLCHLGRYGSHFFCAQGCRKAGKKNCKTQKIIEFSYGRTMQWLEVLGGFWQVRTHAMM